MDFQKTHELIVKIEQQFEVNSICYKGLCLWPLLRLTILQQLGNPHLNFSDNAPTESPTRQINTLSKDIVSQYLLYERLHQHQLLPLKQLERRTELLFFSRSVEHTDRLEGQLYNCTLDPFIELVRGHHSYLKLELTHPYSINWSFGAEKSVESYFEPTIFINPLFLFQKNHLLKSCLPAYKEPIKNFDSFKQLVSKVTEGTVTLNANHLADQVDTLEEFERFFHEILLSIRPKVVFMGYFDYLIAMALIRACRKLGILSVDVQHGLQSPLNSEYNDWTKIPDTGYELLPDFFWVWSPNDVLSKSSFLGQSYHQPILGGNLWLARWMKEDVTGIDDSVKKYLNYLKQWKKVILVSLQWRYSSLEDTLPTYLLEAMSQSPQNWYWLMRFHPAQSDTEKLQITTAIEHYGIQNYDTKYCSICPLPLLLKQTHHHLTAWSSVSYEAATFGVPTIITHFKGLKMFASEIKQTAFNYADCTGTLLNLLTQEFSEDQKHQLNSFAIQADQEQAKKALQFILNKHR